jgi:hypothetical protein
MINTVYSNIFNDNEIILINNIINEELSRRVIVEDESFVNSTEDKYIIKNLNGRMMLAHLPIPPDIFKKIKDFVGLEYVELGCVYAEYDPKHHGNPSLNMHYDRFKDNLCFDYQLDSNTVWPIKIEDKEFILNNNEGITFMTKSQYHGRPEKIFKNGEYVKMLFFFFEKVSNE